jgi:hypothetical protein
VSKGDYLNLKADPDDGTTPIAWLFLEALPLSQLSGLELRCILYLWRETYGWVDKNGVRHKEKILALPDFMEHTGATKPRLSQALATLVGHNVFFRVSLGIGKGYIYRMNTRISEWSDDVIDKDQLRRFIRVKNRETLSRNLTVKNGETLTHEKPDTVAQNLTVKNGATVSHNDPGTVSLDLTPLASNPGSLNKVFKERDISIENSNPLGVVKGTFIEEAIKIWAEVRERLRSQVSARNYRTWLENTEGWEILDTQFIVRVPNSFVGEYLQKNLKGLIEKTLIETSKTSYQVVFKEPQR